jgi:acetyltransferase-like isoleucine patch superfamily enzyme
MMWPADEAPGLVVASDASIGAGVLFGANITVHEGTVVGEGCAIGDNAVLGKRPVLSASSTSAGEVGRLVLGRGVRVSAGAVLSAGSQLGDGCVVGDLATVRERVVVGQGVVIGRGVCIENDVEIGAWTKIQTNAYITAETVLEEHVFIAPGVVTTNDNLMGRTERRHALKRGPTVRRGARVGGAVVLLPGIEVGEEAFIGAGAVVIADVPPRTVVVGVPARVLRDVPAEELLDARDSPTT